MWIAGLLVACVILTIVPFIAAPKDAGFGGADDAAGELVGEIDPEYEPWAEPVLERILGGELPGETESLLFCLQAALGWRDLLWIWISGGKKEIQYKRYRGKTGELIMALHHRNHCHGNQILLMDQYAVCSQMASWNPDWKIMLGLISLLGCIGSKTGLISVAVGLCMVVFTHK